MLLHCRTMKYNIPFFLYQFPERYIRPYAKISGDILHQRPHQCLSRTDCPVIDTDRLIWNQCLFVNRPHNSCSAALRAGPLTVERKLFRTRRHYPLLTYRTINRLFCCHCQCRLYIMTIRTSVCAASLENINRKLFKSSVPVPNVLRIPGTPGL